MHESSVSTSYKAGKSWIPQRIPKIKVGWELKYYSCMLDRDNSDGYVYSTAGYGLNNVRWTFGFLFCLLIKSIYTLYSCIHLFFFRLQKSMKIEQLKHAT